MAKNDLKNTTKAVHPGFLKSGVVLAPFIAKSAKYLRLFTNYNIFYESHYSKALGRKKNHEFTEEESKTINNIDNCGPATKKKYAVRQQTSDVAANLKIRKIRMVKKLWESTD